MTRPTNSPPVPGPDLRLTLMARARRLLAGGIIGTHVVALPVILIGGLVAGPRGLISVALGAVLALLFYTFGQAVQVRFAGASAMTLLAASMMSFFIRAALLAVVLVAWLSLAPPLAARLSPEWACAGVLAGVVGWLLGLARAYATLRITAFDEPESKRTEPGSEAL